MTTNTLTGTTGNDILNSPGSVSTEVQGLQGNDTITLNLTTDVARAGKGDDTISAAISGSADYTVYGGEGKDTVTLGTAVTVGIGDIYGGGGADSIDLRGNSATTTISNATVAGNQGNDTIQASNSLTLTAIQGGQGNDVLTLRGGGTSATAWGGKGKDNIVAVGAFVTSSVMGGKGFDTISASAITNTTTVFVGGGKGGDSISIANQLGTVTGGYLNDTITSLGAFGGGIVYGDATGEKTAGTGTGASADGNDKISFSAGTIASAFSVYGAGGNDTISFAATAFGPGGDVVIDGGNGADLIANSTVLLTGSNSTVAGGAGHDTIKFASLMSAVVLGGAGNDSIFGAAATANSASINGGAGADTINFGTELTMSSASGMVTINGGAGADSIILGTYTQQQGVNASGSGNVLGTVVYESGDIIRFNNDANGAGALASANWLGDTQILVGANRAADYSTIAMSQQGSIAVFSEGNDLVIQITGIACSYQNQVNIKDGKGLLKTTKTGNVTYNSDNFGFTVGTVNSELGITFT